MGSSARVPPPPLVSSSVPSPPQQQSNDPMIAPEGDDDTYSQTCECEDDTNEESNEVATTATVEETGEGNNHSSPV